ncbi:hypothetical protein [Rhizobium johnstonii]|uniref:hypothetical protein n=1 Tax=Rhizobium johnstonii TaxID=3019933 RepID=UPI003F9BAFF1
MIAARPAVGGDTIVIGGKKLLLERKEVLLLTENSLTFGIELFSRAQSFQSVTRFSF